MLIKILDQAGNIVWGDAGDIDSRISFIADEDSRGKFVVGSATLDDGRTLPMRAYLADRSEAFTRRRVMLAFQVENAHIRPRPSAEAIAAATQKLAKNLSAATFR